MSLLRTAILNSLLSKLQSTMSLKSFTRRKFWSFMVSCFLNFSCSLKFCVTLFALKVEVKFSSFCCLIPGEKYLSLFCWQFWCFLRVSLDRSAPNFLLSLVAGFLHSCALYQSYNELDWVWQPPFCFPKGSAERSSFCSLLVYRVRLAFCTCSLAISQILLSPPLWVHTARWMWGVEMCHGDIREC